MKKILLACVAAIAALALSSCDKQETTVADHLKTVTISITNLNGTRSMSAPIADETQVAVSNLQVFFTDGTYLYNGKTTDNVTTQHYFTTTTGLSQTIFHFLPGQVTKALVVANLGQEFTVADDNTTTLASLEETLAIADEQNAASLYLYGEDLLDTFTTNDEHGQVYEADITIYPRVSRFEIVAFTYNQVDETTPRKYTTITVDQIAFNNYYNQADAFTGAVVTTGDAPKTDVEITTTSVYNYFSSLLNPGTQLPLGWNTDLPAALLNADGNYTLSYGTNDCPSYHFFPLGVAQTGGTPELVVKLTATTVADATTTTTPLYLVTSGFDPAITSDFAKIYKINFAFDDNDLENPAKCVAVTVSVANWDVVEVVPTF